jgi:hypothetical protein
VTATTPPLAARFTPLPSHHHHHHHEMPAHISLTREDPLPRKSLNNILRSRPDASISSISFHRDLMEESIRSKLVVVPRPSHNRDTIVFC